MTHAAKPALAHPCLIRGGPSFKPVTDLVPRRPIVREAGVDRDDEIAPGIDIDAFRRGDFDTFRAVLQHFGPLIRTIAASYTDNAHDREELYQEITVRLWQRRAQYSARGPLGGWINRIAHRVCLQLAQSAGGAGGGRRTACHRSARTG